MAKIEAERNDLQKTFHLFFAFVQGLGFRVKGLGFERNDLHKTFHVFYTFIIQG